MVEKQELLERRGLRKMGGENSPISPPLDPRLVEQNIVICQWRADQLFAEAEDTGKSRYFAITEFNTDNCFIIRSPRLFSYFDHFLAAQGSDLP